MKKNKMLAGALALALSIGAIAPSFTSYADGVRVSDSDNVADFGGGGSSGSGQGVLLVQPHFTTIRFQKVMYEDPTTKPELGTNKGEKIELPEGVVPFDTEKYGDVEFTLYKIKDNKGFDDKINELKETNPDKSQSELIDLALDGDKDKKIFEEVKRETLVGKKDSVIDFENLEGGPDLVHYVIRETTSDKNLVAEKAETSLITLPIVNKDGTGYEDEIFMYPKNKVQKLTVKLLKSLNTEDNKLDGIKFDLYRGTPGSPDAERINKEDEPYVTADGGKIVVDDLTLGSYFFVERDLPYFSTKKNETEGIDNNVEYYLSHYAQNDEYNKLKFNIEASTEVEYTDKELEITNYTKPESDKKLDRETSETDELLNRDFEVDSKAPFKMHIDVPYDVAGGHIKQEDGQKTVTKGYKMLRVTDTPDKALSLNEQGLPYDLKVQTEDGVKLEEGVDYTIKSIDTPNYQEDGKKNAKSFLIDFIVKSEDKTDEFGRVSEKVANAKGKKIEMTYKLKLNENAFGEVNQKINNEMIFEYDNDPRPDSEQEEEKHEDYVTTFGAKFKKISGKTLQNLGGKGEAGKGLEGAEFNVYKEIDGQKQYLVKQNNEDATESVWSTNADEAHTFTSDENGEFLVNGLEKDTQYYLQETKAPEGYNLDNRPTTFTVSNKTIEVGQEIVNMPEGEIPLTGAITLLGVVFVAGGAAVASKKLKKED